MESKRIDEIIVEVTEAMVALGISPYTAWQEYSKVYEPIMRLHRTRGHDHLDEATVNDFLTEAGRLVESGKETGARYLQVKRGVKRLLEFYRTKNLEWTFPERTSKFKLNPYYENLISDFISSSDFHPNTQGDILWIARKYFAWLIKDGKPDLDGVGASEVQNFLVFCSNHMKRGSIHNTKLYLKKLYAYLSNKGLSSDNYNELLSFKAIRGTRVYPAASADDLAKIFACIDRRVSKGKRDYAIIMLGAVTGLRAIDIARLKLADIDWQKGEIKIVQEKTGCSLALPLTKDVGEAISEYILRGRQTTKSEEVFLREHRPYCGFKDSVSIGDMYDAYRKQAGLPRDPFDGNGFHTLRRGVGKNLVTSHIPVTDVAQILGVNIETTKRYIALDSIHLKECAISFVGIEPITVTSGGVGQ